MNEHAHHVLPEAVREGPVVLAHEPPLRIAPLTIDPAMRSIVHDDGRKEILEQRVMQVLVALLRPGGAILSRDDLVFRCWDGRIVGDDAIHRVISRLRRAADGIGADVFRVETITKVGYRLVVAGFPPPDGVSFPPTPLAARPGRPDRRLVLGGAVAAAGLAGLGAYLWKGFGPAAPAAEAVAFYRRGRDTQGQALPDTTLQAVAYFREAVRIDPDYSEAWGALALAYRGLLEFGDRPDAARVAALSRSAAARALELDPGNMDARAALVLIRPFFGNWAGIEADCRRLLRADPRREVLRFNLAWLLQDVGRTREAVEILVELAAEEPFWPLTRYFVIRALWSTGRLEEAEAASEDALRRWPGHPLIWQIRIVFLMYSGRPAAALAFAGEAQAPTGYRSESIEATLSTARALLSPTRAAVDEAVAAKLVLVTRQPETAAWAAQACAALQRPEESFALFQGFYLGTGQWARAGLPITPLRRRFATPLFEPPCAPLWQDRRFAALLQETGLETYWRSTATFPDYRRG